MRCTNAAGKRPTYKAISVERGEMQCWDHGRQTETRRGVQEETMGEREEGWRKECQEKFQSELITRDTGAKRPGQKSKTKAWRKNWDIYSGKEQTPEGDTRGPMWVKGFWLEGVVSLFSMETSESIWVLAGTCWGWNQKQSPGSGFGRAAGHVLKPGQTGLEKEALQTTGQIRLLISNGHGRKDLTQPATGLDTAHHFSLRVLGDCAGVSSNCTHSNDDFCLCFWKTRSKNPEM